MNKYLELFRLENGVIGIIGLLASAFIAVSTDLLDYWVNVIIGCAVVIFFIAGGNSVNDYVDREIDKVSHPDRPIPSGRLEPKKALYIGSACLIIACALSFFLGNWLSIAIVVAAVILMVLYETMLKQRGFVGNVAIAILTGMVFLLGGSITGHVENCYYVAGMAALVSVGREITKDIEDMDGDAGRSTLPMRLGKRNAGIVAAIFYILGPCLSIVPMFLHTFNPLYFAVIIADAMFIYAAIILFDNPHKSQKIAKLAMFVALIIFILGVVPWE